MNPERAVSYRKQASALIEAVIADEISPRAALNTWPLLGNEDSSVRCAYTMLWFYESDEERHHRELFYSDIQIQALKEVCQYLKQGAPLPNALLQEYQGAMAPPEYHSGWTWRQPLWWMRQQIRWFLVLLETHPALSRKQGKSQFKGPR